VCPVGVAVGVGVGPARAGVAAIIEALNRGTRNSDKSSCRDINISFLLVTSPSAEPSAYVWTSPGIGPDPLGKCPLEWKGRVNRSLALSLRQTYFRPGSRLLDHEQALAGRSDDVLTGVTGYHDACVGTRFTEAPRCQVVMPLVSGGEELRSVGRSPYRWY
jgi:hypothetical protein